MFLAFGGSIVRTCMFCGHSKIYSGYEKLKENLTLVVSDLIEHKKVEKFLIGNYGQFDRMSASICLDLKRLYPDIKVELVLPYYRHQVDEYERVYYLKFDNVIIPELENVPYRYRITKANEYMVKRSDIVVTYVNKTTGGAAKTMAYAKRMDKKIINLDGLCDDK